MKPGGECVMKVGGMGWSERMDNRIEKEKKKNKITFFKKGGSVWVVVYRLESGYLSA